MHRRRRTSDGLALGAAFVALALAGCARPPGSDDSIVAGDAEAVRAAFNAAADKPRVLAIVSPGCGGCLVGAAALRRIALEDRPNAEVAVIIVWSAILPGDDAGAAGRAAIIYDDRRALQFYDANAMVARAFAPVLFEGGTDLPWDAYLFYPAGPRWGADRTPPRPSAWTHQLSGGGATEQFRIGDDSFGAMHRFSEAIIGAGPDRAPTREDLQPMMRSLSRKMAAATPARAGDLARTCDKCEFDDSQTLCDIGGQRRLVFELASAERDGLLAVRLNAIDVRCGGCMFTIAAALAADSAVQRVEVDFDAQEVVAHVQPPIGAAEARLRGVLRRAGY